jgi:hypothetical protein
MDMNKEQNLNYSQPFITNAATDISAFRLNPNKTNIASLQFDINTLKKNQTEGLF